MANGHGGARAGAGRKPKALRYEEQVTAVEERIVQMLPRLVEKLYEMAMDGDLRATRYLIDRIMGRVPALTAAPSTDRSIPYGDREFTIEKLGHSLKLEKDELRFERERDEIFECEDEDEEETYDELISASPEDADGLPDEQASEQELWQESANENPATSPRPIDGQAPRRRKRAGRSARTWPFPPTLFGPNGALALSLSGASPALRALLEDDDPPSTSPICPIEKTIASTRSTVDRPPASAIAGGRVADVPAPQSNVEPPSSIPFIESDSPHDPERAWYSPST